MLMSYNIYSQNQYLDDIYLQDKLRAKQLLGDTGIKNSFIYRSPQTLQRFYKDNLKSSKKVLIMAGQDLQYNSLLPVSYNDGNLYPARGWQYRYSIGALFSNKYIDINLQPEVITANNKLQENYAGNVNDGNFAARYFGYVANNIDNYRQFGKKSIDTITWGQSRIGFKFKELSLGVSNQNIWIGPGKRNSITMSNNAPGFKHFYFNTNKPIQTKIGSFEFSYISGVIDTIKYKDPDEGLLSGWTAGIANKAKNKRIIDVYSITWSPKWTRGFFIGYSYTSQHYITNSVIKINNEFTTLDSYNQKLGSLFFRLLLPKENAEIYGELGVPDGKPTFSNLFSDKTNTGILLGASKLIRLSKTENFLNFNFEITQLQLMDSKSLFQMGNPYNNNPINSWYTNTFIRQGYTNEAQIMGASIGPGSNSQTFNGSWNSAKAKIGLQLERVAINNDFYFIQYYVGKNSVGGLNGSGGGYYNRYWVELNSSFYTEYSISNRIFLLASIMNTNSMNYRWVRNEDGSKWDKPSSLSDKYNTRLNFSMRFYLN